MARPLSISASRVAPPTQRTDAAFLADVHLARGLAILQIVFVHAAESFLHQATGAGETTPAMAALETLFHDATIYFSLISGILYVHVFAPRGVLAFYKARALNVAAPYLLLTAALTVWGVAAGGDWAALPERLALNVRLGSAWYHFWYMPVALTLSALAPLLLASLRAPNARWLFALLLAAPLIFTRTGNYPGPQTIVYFVGSFSVGLLIGLDADRTAALMTRWRVALGAVAVAATGAIFALFLTGIDLVGFVSLRESLFYVQKLALAGLAIPWLRAWASREGRWRDLILGRAARWAFAIYFLHGIVVSAVLAALSPFHFGGGGVLELAAGALFVFTASLALTVALIALVKRLLGPASRYVVGA
jgi:peptidoglycan/LPS O-acetylase OafA/YrhL